MSTPARSEEVYAVLGDVDPLILTRVLESGASVDEIGEALQLAADSDDPTTPSSSAVVEVRGILYELFDVDTDEFVFPIEGVRI